MNVSTVFHHFKSTRCGNRAAILIFGIALVLSAAPLEAGLLSSCLIDVAGVSGCTAGDMGINNIVVTVVKDGCINPSDTATVNIQLQINAANPTRYDVGLFLAMDGGDAIATGGSCFHEALFPVLTPAGTIPTATERASGIGGFLLADTDSCGEVNKENSYQRLLVQGDVSSGSITPAELVISCADIIDGAGNALPNGFLDLGWVIGWVQNAGNVNCTSVNHAVPGTSSKCQSGRTDSSNFSGVPIGIPSLGLTLNCTPDQVGPGDTVSCTMNYSNTGVGPGDNIEYRIDFPEGTGTVSNISTDPAYDTASSNGPTDATTGTASDYIQVVPAGGTTPALANIPVSTTQSMTFDFTVSDTASDDPFTITAYTWFNNGTSETYQSQEAADTTQVTPALISDFTTHRHHGQTLVRWQTAAETGTAGFYLERKDSATGQWTRVNDGLLPALLERPGGGTYAFLDTKATSLTRQTYRLIAVDFTDNREIHGPFERSAVRSSGIKDFDVLQRKGFARKANRPSTASVAAWDAKRDERTEELNFTTSAKGLAPVGVSLVNARIKIEGEGLFTLSAATLADHFRMGEREVQRALKQGKLRLSHHGSPVAYLPSNDLDRVYFFGQKIDSRYTDENTYWATFEKRSAVGSVNLMDEIGGYVPNPVSRPQTFLSTTTIEEDVWLVTYAVQDPDADIWFGGFISTGYYGNTTYVTNLQAPDASAAGQAEIRVELNGLTNLTAGNDHHAEVRLNGALIGEAIWDGVTPHTLVASFDQTILSAGINSLEVNGVLDGDVEQSSFVVDTVDLTYNRHYRALDDALIFGSDGHRAITVDGFSGPDVEVFDLQNAARPVHVTATRVENSGAGYRVTFAAGSADGKYLAVRQATAAGPLSLEIDQPSTLRSPNNAAEYVVIAPASLNRGAQALVDYRRQRFSSARLIDLQNIYDEFNAGIEDPSAVNSFLKYALASWKIAPHFVALAGKGTLDPKDIQGYGTNVLPLTLCSTPYGVFASDSRMADVVGSDGVPDVAIGRIPALSSAELMAYVDKLRLYESSNRAAGAQNALMLADDKDGAGNFPADSLNVAARLPDGVTAIHVNHQTGSDAALTRQQVLEAFDQGIMLFNYIGHGAPTQMGSEAFWAMPDIAGLNNVDQLPIFAAFTCYAGNGSYPGLNSLTDEMTLLGAGGVIAALAPTGLSVNDRAVILDQAFVRALLERGQTIGEATQSAIQHLHRQGGPQFMQEIYNIVGDPAVEIHR